MGLQKYFIFAKGFSRGNLNVYVELTPWDFWSVPVHFLCFDYSAVKNVEKAERLACVFSACSARIAAFASFPLIKKQVMSQTHEVGVLPI